MNGTSNLRFRLVTVTMIFLAIAPTLGLIFNSDDTKDIVWIVLLAASLALTLAWVVWGDYFLRQTRILFHTTKRLAGGDLTARTNLKNETGDLDELARNIDAMAAALEKHQRDREQVEQTLLNRTHQQTLIAALGQFAMVSNDLDELLNQAMVFIGQTLQIECTGVWKMNPDHHTLTLHAGTGWKPDTVGRATLETGVGTMIGHMLTHVEPLVVEDLRQETRFSPPFPLTDHSIVSCINTNITGGIWSYGVLGVYSTKPRKFTEDEIYFLIAIANVIATAVNRRNTESQLLQLAEFAQRNPNPVIEFAADGGLNYFNDAAMNMAIELGYENVQGYLPAEIREIIRDCLANGKSRLRFETRPGNHIISWSFFPIAAKKVVHCYVGDVTELREKEAQLLQSQKMESIGQLAAGVAHDFNNMLTIIQGHSGIIMARPNLPNELADSAQAIYFASERAASLTRQLLLFSRKNIAQPKAIDLREVVSDMTKMLKRLLGEHILLNYVPPAHLPSLRGDHSMMEQIIMNLAVNARDAMPKGGKLTINITSHNLDRSYAQIHPQARPGHFIRLQVADTGIGMPPEVQARIFEPFFTTKEVGKGTGLGLATVYGIVKQHEGWIEVASESGKGTTFDVFLPISTETIDSPAPTAAAITTRTTGGNETILVVEDEPVLRNLARLILSEHGYRVLEAANGVEALAVWEKERQHINLLLTDMVMPEGMSGRELAEQLRAQEPRLKVVCVSGYSIEDVNQAGIIFLQKPYTRLSLAKTVRDCLDK